MAKTFELTNSLSALATPGVEVIGVGFINNGAFEILNNCSVSYDSFSTEQKAIIDAFLDLMRIQVLTCPRGDGAPS